MDARSDARPIDEYVDINYSWAVSSRKSKNVTKLATEKVPFETTLLVRDCCLCLHVQRAARSLARRFDEALRPFGLTNGQFSLLMSLNRLEPPAMAPIASLLAMDRTTLTAALKPLERRGLVRILPDPADRRGRILKLTDAAHVLLLRAMPVWQRIHEEVEQLIPDQNLDELRRSLLALS